MGAARLGLRYPPFRSGETHILPSHGQHLGASRAGQECSQQNRTDRGVRLFGYGLKEPRQFVGLYESIAWFLVKELDAGRGILPCMEPPVLRQSKHLAEQRYQAIRAIGCRLADGHMQVGYIVPAQIRQFSRAKDRKMGGEHRPVKTYRRVIWCDYGAKHRETA